MIVDSIKNTDCGKYPEAFKKVFEYFKTLTKDTPDGTVELDGRKVYVMVQSGETAGDTAEKMELHRKYIDIQYVIDGSEGMICAIDDGRMNVVHPYDDEKDYLLVSTPAEILRLDMQPGMFAVFAPQDAHNGKMASASKGPMFIRKAVAKIAVELA